MGILFLFIYKESNFKSCKTLKKMKRKSTDCIDMNKRIKISTPSSTIDSKLMELSERFGSSIISPPSQQYTSENTRLFLNRSDFYEQAESFLKACLTSHRKHGNPICATLCNQISSKGTCFFKLGEILREWNVPVYSYSFPASWQNTVNREGEDNIDCIIACCFFKYIINFKQVDEWREWMTMDRVWTWIRQHVQCDPLNPTCFLLEIGYFKPHNSSPSIMLKVLQVLERYCHQPGLIVIPVFKGTFLFDDLQHLLNQTHFQNFDLPLSPMRPSDIKEIFMNRCIQCNKPEKQDMWDDNAFQLIRLSPKMDHLQSGCHDLIHDKSVQYAEEKTGKLSVKCPKSMMSKELTELIMSCNEWKGSAVEKTVIEWIRFGSMLFRRRNSVYVTWHSFKDMLSATLLDHIINHFDHSQNHMNQLMLYTLSCRLIDYQQRQSSVKFHELFKGFDCELEFDLPTTPPKLVPLETVTCHGGTLQVHTFKSRREQFQHGASDLFSTNTQQQFNACWMTHCNGRKTMICFKMMWNGGEYSREELKAMELEFPDFGIIWMIVSSVPVENGDGNEDTDGDENVFVMDGRLLLENTCPNLWAYFYPIAVL